MSHPPDVDPPDAHPPGPPAGGAHPPGPPASGGTGPPWRGVAAGLALVLVAVLVGLVIDRGASGPVTPATGGVPATGEITTVSVTADGMRYDPDHITVPSGNRLVIELTNRDRRRHDLVLSNGADSGIVARGGTVRLDAGVIGTGLEGWCSLPGHRQAGMTMTITVDGGAAVGAGGDPAGDDPVGPVPVDPLAEPGPGFTAREATAPEPPPARVHRVELRVEEVEREVAPGVRQQLWTFNGTAPGPVLRGRVGDTFEITLVNDGSIDHGVDLHAGALAPDRAMRPIEPGERLSYRFTGTRAGVWMYHCATMPMLHHIGNGMYGAVIIDPPDLPEVDREYVLVQSELYLGPDGAPGDLAKMQQERPDAVVFNGYAGQYAHRPLTASAGERVRFWVLNAGPSRSSAFHVVGTRFDTVYQEGNWRLRPDDPGGAQILDLPPASGGFVEAVFPEAGRYPFLTHAIVDAERGARGIVEVGAP